MILKSEQKNYPDEQLRYCEGERMEPKQTSDYLKFHFHRKNIKAPITMRINPIIQKFPKEKIWSQSTKTIQNPKIIKKLGNLTLAFCIILLIDIIVLPLINFYIRGL